MLRIFSITTLVVNVLAFFALLLFGNTILNIFASYNPYSIGTQWTLYAPLAAQAIAMFVGLQAVLLANVARKVRKDTTASVATGKALNTRIWVLYPLWTLVVLAISVGIHWWFLRTATYQLQSPIDDHLLIGLMQFGYTVAAILLALLVAVARTQWSQSKGIALTLLVLALVVIGMVMGANGLLYEVSTVLEYKTSMSNEEEHYANGYFDPSMLLRDEYRNPSNSSEPDGEYEEGEEEESSEPEYDYVYVDEAPLGTEDAAKSAEAVRILQPENVAERKSAGTYLYTVLAEQLLDPEYDLHDGLQTFGYENAHHNYKNSTGGVEYNRLYTYFLYHPSVLIPALEQNKGLILELLPKSRYKQSRIPLLVNLLLESHAQLYDHNDDPEAALSYIYRLMLRQDRDNNWIPVHHHYGDMESYINTSGQAAAAIERACGDYHLEYLSVMVWSYSFWARRHHQGNDATAYTALTTIRKMYQ